MKRLCACWLFLALMTTVFGLRAQPELAGNERIHRYDVDMRLLPDGTLDVTESIEVEAHGANIRRGLYRDFPTRYRDRLGNRVEVGFDVQGLQRDGRQEPYTVESRGNGVRVNFGSDELLPVPAVFRYTLRYRTHGQLGFFDGHDELYFNAIGTGWNFPIDAAKAALALPQAVPTAQMKAECWTGRQGSREQGCSAQLVDPGGAQWNLARGLQPGEGFTIVLAFPKGIFAAPTRAERVQRTLRQNIGVGVGLLSLLLMLAYCVWRWRRHGRDPRPGPIFPRYQPPAGYGPAALATVRGRSSGNRPLVADLLVLALRGRLTLEHVPGRLLRGEYWVLTDSGRGWSSIEDDPAALPALTDEQLQLHRTLFADQSRVELKADKAPLLQKALAAHTAALRKQLGSRYYQANGREIAIAAGLALLLCAATLLIGGPYGMPLRVLLVGLMVITWVVFAILIGRPTAAGRALRDEIEGFRMYLGVAERDELAAMPGPDGQDPMPPLDGERYKALLPYAVALGVENEWTRKFTRAVGVAMAEEVAASMPWLQSHPGGSGMALNTLVNNFSSSLSSNIASASSPPGSSSGGGGGGFSGGGGGGGGGGGR